MAKRPAPRLPQPNQLPAPPPGQPVDLDQLDQSEQVIRWIVSGASYTEITKAIRRAWPEANAAAIIDQAAAQLRTAGTADPDLIRGYCIEGAREIYRRCCEAGDMPSAMKALKLLASFYPPPEAQPLP